MFPSASSHFPFSFPKDLAWLYLSSCKARVENGTWVFWWSHIQVGLPGSLALGGMMGQGRSKGNGRSCWRHQSAWRFQCGFSLLFMEKGIRSKRNVFTAGKHLKNKQQRNQSAQRNRSSQREWRDLHIQSEAAGKELQRDYANP